MKNRYTWLALTLALVLVLAGCGGGEEIPQTSPVETEQTVPVETDQTAPVETEQTAPVETEPTVPEQTLPEDAIVLGYVEGDVYTNTYAGFACTLDSNWTYYTVEELMQLPENVEEVQGDTEMGASLAEMEQINAMMAENVGDLTSINIMYTKMEMPERLAYAAMSEEEILDALLTEADAMQQTYTQAGYEVISMEKAEVEFLGETHYALKTCLLIQGMEYYNLQLFDYHAGQYGITTTLSSFLVDKTGELLAVFTEV